MVRNFPNHHFARQEAQYAISFPRQSAEKLKLQSNRLINPTPEFIDNIRINPVRHELNFSLRKVTKNRAAFPNDDAILKIMYLALTNASKKWTMPIRDWGAALNQFAVYFGDRIPL